MHRKEDKYLKRGEFWEPENNTESSENTTVDSSYRITVRRLPRGAGQQTTTRITASRQPCLPPIASPPKTAVAPVCDSIPEANPADQNFERHGPFVRTTRRSFTTIISLRSRTRPHLALQGISKNRESESYRLLASCSTPVTMIGTGILSRNTSITQGTTSRTAPGLFAAECPRAWIRYILTGASITWTCSIGIRYGSPNRCSFGR